VQQIFSWHKSNTKKLKIEILEIKKIKAICFIMRKRTCLCKHYSSKKCIFNEKQKQEKVTMDSAFFE